VFSLALNQDQLFLYVVSGVLFYLVLTLFYVQKQRATIQFHEQTIKDLKREFEYAKLGIEAGLREEHKAVLGERDLRIARMATLLQEREYQLSLGQQELAELKVVKDEYIQLLATVKEKETSLISQELMLEQTKSTLFKEFEISANKLMESKQALFSQSSRNNIEEVLKPFREQLSTFNQRVEDVYHKENSQRNQLVGQIALLQKQTQKMSDDANNLANALKGDTKIQGNWGEVVLERLLEQSGLEKGREYETQLHLKNHDGKSFRPDVVVRLPEGKDIVIDSKVSLVDYERYMSEPYDETFRVQALKSHVESIKSHVKGLSFKKYEQLEGIRTLDFVFIFIPIEAAYLSAVQSYPGLVKEAYDKNVMLVSPSSLMVALRTVETMWRYEKQNTNAEKIAESAGRLYDQFVLVMGALEEVGAYIGKAADSFDSLRGRLVSGRGNVLNRIEGLKKLGAKTSKSFSKTTTAELEEENSLAEGLVVDNNDLVVDSHRKIVPIDNNTIKQSDGESEA
jgi:DNA recombination protein RmuC